MLMVRLIGTASSAMGKLLTMLLSKRFDYHNAMSRWLICILLPFVRSVSFSLKLVITLPMCYCNQLMMRSVEDCLLKKNLIMLYRTCIT